jgi:hypothetical protein
MSIAWSRWSWTIGLLAIAACRHAPEMRTPGPSVEVALDDGQAAEKPLTPARTFEVLMKIDPGLPAYVPRRMRFLLAQGGHVIFTLYGTGPDGGPGATLCEIDRIYDPTMISSGKDGKWVVEELTIPGPNRVQRTPVWVGIHGPAGGTVSANDPRLWASSHSSGLVFQRDPDPATPLSSTAIPRTPLLRVEVEPANELPTSPGINGKYL